MAAYSNFIGSTIDSIYESVLPDVDMDSLLEDTSIEPCLEDNFAVAGARICAENTANMNAIMEACAIQEFCVYESTGEEMVYEGTNGDGFFAKIKAFFLKLWEKIQGIFKKAIMMFNTKAKSDKDFYNKYKKEITGAMNASYDDKEIAMYDYIFYGSKNTKDVMTGLFSTDLYKDAKLASDNQSLSTTLLTKAKVSKSDININDNLGDVDGSDSDADKEAIKNLDEAIKRLNESDWKHDYYDELRGNLVKQLDSSYNTTQVSAKEFASEIAEVCQGDTTKTNTGMSTAIRKAAGYLETSHDIVKGLDGGLKAWKMDIDETVKEIENKQKQFKKITQSDKTGAGRVAGYRHSMLSIAVQVLKEAKNIGISYHSNIMQQIKACSGQSKSICVQAVHYKKPKNESSVYTEEQTGSVLDSIKFV